MIKTKTFESQLIDLDFDQYKQVLIRPQIKKSSCWIDCETENPEAFFNIYLIDQKDNEKMLINLANKEDALTVHQLIFKKISKPVKLNYQFTIDIEAFDHFPINEIKAFIENAIHLHNQPEKKIENFSVKMNFEETIFTFLSSCLENQKITIHPSKSSQLKNIITLYQDIR